MKKINISDVCSTYPPKTLSVADIAYRVMDNAKLTVECCKRVLNSLYGATGNGYYRVRYMQVTHTNNWLKMHGYPMRRKG